MTKKWRSFILKSEAKYQSHIWASRYWSKINKVTLTLMAVLGAVATLLALLQTVDIFVVAGLAAGLTFVICIYAVVQPAEKKHKHLRSAKDFQNLMMRMVRCKGGIEFEQLWHDMNRCVFEEPRLKKRHLFPISTDTDSIQWTMTQELTRVIELKKEEAKKRVKQFSNRCVGTTSDVINVEPWQFNNSYSYRAANGIVGGGAGINPSYNTYPSTSSCTSQNGAITAYNTYNNSSNSGLQQHSDYGFIGNGGFDQHHHRAIVTTTANGGNRDDDFEVLIAQKSHQEVWEDGKRKKRQIFEQFRRSKSAVK